MGKPQSSYEKAVNANYSRRAASVGPTTKEATQISVRAVVTRYAVPVHRYEKRGSDKESYDQRAWRTDTERVTTVLVG